MREKISDCIYNPGVGCQERTGCDTCGWNPETDHRRRSGTRGKDQAPVRRDQEVKP